MAWRDDAEQAYRAAQERAGEWALRNRARETERMKEHSAFLSKQTHQKSAYHTLVSLLRVAITAQPDELAQIDVDAAAQMILDRWPPRSFM
jgi:hypothetical protein